MPNLASDSIKSFVTNGEDWIENSLKTALNSAFVAIFPSIQKHNSNLRKE